MAFMVNAAFHTAVGSSYEAAVQAEEDERLLGTQSPPPQLSLGERKKMNSSYLGEKVVFLNLRATAERLHTCTPDLWPGPQSGAAPRTAFCCLQGLPGSGGTPGGRRAAGKEEPGTHS